MKKYKNVDKQAIGHQRVNMRVEVQIFPERGQRRNDGGHTARAVIFWDLWRDRLALAHPPA